jgi:hypothetical protein
MKTKLRFVVVALIAGGTMFAQSRLSIGVGVGGYSPRAYQPPAYAQNQPPCPGPGYTWVDGYWAPQGGRNVWIGGNWRRPLLTAAPRNVEPDYDNAYRGNDRNDRDRDRDRGHDNLGQNRGDERHDAHNDNRGNGYSNGFRR